MVQRKKQQTVQNHSAAVMDLVEAAFLHTARLFEVLLNLGDETSLRLKHVHDLVVLTKETILLSKGAQE